MKITFTFYDANDHKKQKTLDAQNRRDCVGLLFALDLHPQVKRWETKIEREPNESVTDWLNRSSEIYEEVESLQNRYAPYGVILQDKVINDFTEVGHVN